MAEKDPNETDDLFDDSVLDEVVDLDAETPHPDIEPNFAAETEEAVEELEPVADDGFEVTEELGDAVAAEIEGESPASEFEVTETLEETPEPAAGGGFEIAEDFEETPEAAQEEKLGEMPLAAEDEPEVEDFDEPEEAADDAGAFEEDEETGDNALEEEEFTEEETGDEAGDNAFEKEEFTEEEEAGDDASEEEPVEDEVTGPRRGGAADRYQKTAKQPPSKRKKRVMAALILSLPVMFVGIVIAGFFIRQPYYPNIEGSPEVNAWHKLLIVTGLAEEPPKPEIARPPVKDDGPLIPPDTLVRDYHAEQNRVVREVGVDILRGRLDAELSEAGVTEPDKALKKKFFWEADKIIKNIESAENRLKLIWADMEAKQVEGITPQKHTELMNELAATRTALEAFREENKPNEAIGTDSTVTPKDPSPLIAEYERAFAGGKDSLRTAAALQADLQREQGEGALTRPLARKYFDLAADSIDAIGDLETRLKALMVRMESEGVENRPTDKHMGNLDELSALRAALEQFQNDHDPQSIAEMPAPSPLIAEYDRAYLTGKPTDDAEGLRGALKYELGELGIDSPTLELAQSYHDRADEAIEAIDRLVEDLNRRIAQMGAEGIADIPAGTHENRLEELATMRSDLESFRDNEVDPASITMPEASPLPAEYSAVWDARNLTDAAVLRSNLKAELEALGLAAPNRAVAGKHYDLAAEAIAAIDALEADLTGRMRAMNDQDVAGRPTDAHAGHLAELAGIRTELKTFREGVDPSKIAVAPPPAVEDTPLKQFEALRDKLNRAGLDESITLLTEFLAGSPDDRFRGWAEQEVARLEQIRADRTARETPETPRKSPDDLIKEGTDLVVKCAESIKRLIKTEIPEDSTAQLELRLESEDVLAGLDDAQFKYSRALEDLKADPNRAEDVKKLEASLTRIRQLRKAFSEDFVRRLDRKSGSRQ